MKKEPPGPAVAYVDPSATYVGMKGDEVEGHVLIGRGTELVFTQEVIAQLVKMREEEARRQEALDYTFNKTC